MRPQGIRMHVPKINDLHETKYREPVLKDETKPEKSDLEKAKPKKDKNGEEINLFA